MIFSKEEEKEKVKECDRLPSDSAYFTTSESKARLLLNSQNQQSPLPGNTNLHQKKVCGTFKDSILNFFFSSTNFIRYSSSQNKHILYLSTSGYLVKMIRSLTSHFSNKIVGLTSSKVGTP